MVSTRNQEREALEQIRNIIEGLGENSYVGAAFEGVFEIAEENIENDMLNSAKEKMERKDSELKKARDYGKALESQMDELQKENEKLKKDLEKAEGWHMYGEDGTESNVSQKEYEALSKSGRVLSDSEAAALVADEFGFSREKVEIIHEIETWEINNRRQMRKTGTVERNPVYDASDWNYVRFNVRCGGITWFYEMDDGDLRQYNC